MNSKPGFNPDFVFSASKSQDAIMDPPTFKEEIDLINRNASEVDEEMIDKGSKSKQHGAQPMDMHSESVRDREVNPGDEKFSQEQVFISSLVWGGGNLKALQGRMPGASSNICLFHFCFLFSFFMNQLKLMKKSTCWGHPRITHSYNG
ncbi:uncharacterized protein LOC129302835 [Prosopis cineraria]|uniref:uncharacterized protein LOC129302835 n=1 Tax=Prosopis cineraria TaxID=364024 RepID=UPI00240FD29B|nr:uncharacterized protein LOC129302835 [Prosopis cineraria]